MSHSSEWRRTAAGALYEQLRVELRDLPSSELWYNGNAIVQAGPVWVYFDRKAVSISFDDPYANPDEDQDEDTSLVLSIAGPYTFGALAAIVKGLATQLAVTS